MVLIKDIYELLLAQTRIDGRGDGLSISEFNRMARAVNQEVYDDYVALFEGDLESSDTMGGFKVFNYNIALALDGGMKIGTIPDNYFQLIGKPHYLDGATVRYLDLVSNYEDSVREEDFLTKASATYPTCMIGGLINGDLQIRCRPTTLTSVDIDYLMIPTVPFLDYYVNDTTFQKTFLDASSSPNLDAGNTYVDPVTGVVTIGGAGVIVVSHTANFDWDDSDMQLIIAKFMQKIGNILPDTTLLQGGMAEEIKTQG
jgi:hypothetical protein